MAQFKIIPAVALIESGNRILLQQRPPESEMGGLWEFPGGKVEPGESLKEALIRELAEELGITVDADDLVEASFSVTPSERQELLLLLFACRHWAGEPRPLFASELAWVSLDALDRYAMPPADVPLVSALRQLISSAPSA